ncbi:MAG TPA: dTDP-4-dehydrorhamnose reductase [Thermoguttaceae bacterium]
MKIVVTGALGQLGSELCRQIGPQAIPLDIDTLDLTNGKAVIDMLRPMRLDMVINCAAYTQVDKAEKEPDLAFAVNATAVENLVSVCREADCPLVQISTDYVFGCNEATAGTNRPYREDDPPSPQSVYAKSKLAGEQVAASYEKHLIVRTCGLYARPSDKRAQNFVKTMLRFADTLVALRIVADQYCTPSYVPHVARAVMFLAGLTNSQPAPWGIYHVTNSGACTWYDFAVEIFRQAGINTKPEAITSAEYAAPAARPSYSVLDTTAYHRIGGPPMPDWKAALEEYFCERRKLQIAQ